MKIRSVWCLFFVLSLPAESFGEEKKVEKVIGILGESVTFHLKRSEHLTLINWLQLTRDITNIAIVEEGQPCHIRFLSSKFEGRLNVSRDCRSLQISNLRQNYSGNYRAQIQDYKEDFSLEIYKNLSESDLEVQCENNTVGDGNYTLQLNCSAGKWGDGVNYIWMSKDRNSSSHVIQSHFQDGDANYTCTAENPVSKASKSVSVKEACEAHPTAGPGTVATPEAGSDSKWIAVWVVLAIVAIAAAVTGCVLWKKKKRASPSVPPDPTVCTVPDESIKTIYAQIDPPKTQQTGMKKSRLPKRPNAQEGPHTVYASVTQPKPMSLRTDDEKIKMEGLGNSQKSEKTIYLTVTKPQETDDEPSIKTVYDTVNAPRRPEGSEFHKLL